MIKNILNGYVHLFTSLGKIIVILAICIGLGFAVVWPLWKWATVNSTTYTIFILAVLVIYLLSVIFKEIKKHSFKTVAITFIRILVIAGGVFFFIFFVLKSHRIFALLSLVTMIFLYGLFSFSLIEREK